MHMAVPVDARQILWSCSPANPAGNALYQRLGYRPVEDRVVLRFGP